MMSEAFLLKHLRPCVSEEIDKLARACRSRVESDESVVRPVSDYLCRLGTPW